MLKAEAWKRGLVARSCASTGRKDVVREVKGMEKIRFNPKRVETVTGKKNDTFRSDRRSDAVG